MEAKTRNNILLVLFVGVLMGALDIAIVGPALPTIRKDFAVDDRAIAWVFAIYVLFNLSILLFCFYQFHPAIGSIQQQYFVSILLL